MKTRYLGIFLILFTAILISIGQLLLKAGVNKLELSLYGLITNYILIIGVVVYFTSAALFIFALKFGELSLLYPLFATSYIWVSLLSPRFFESDSMNTLKWVGVFIIIMGVMFIGFRGKND